MNTVIYMKLKSGKFEPYDIIYLKKIYENVLLDAAFFRKQNVFRFPSPINLQVLSVGQIPKLDSYTMLGDTLEIMNTRKLQIRAWLTAHISSQKELSFCVEGDGLKYRLEKAGSVGKRNFTSYLLNVIIQDIKRI